MKATELIARLQDLVDEYGDREVYHGGQDYPETVRSAVVISKKRASGYEPEGVIKID